MTDLLLRRHFARLTLAALPHPCAFRGGGVSECVPAQFACPLTLPVFVGNDCCAPLVWGAAKKAATLNTKTCGRLTVPFALAKGRLAVSLMGFLARQQNSPSVVAFAAPTIAVFLRQDGVAYISSLCMSSSAV